MTLYVSGRVYALSLLLATAASVASAQDPCNAVASSPVTVKLPGEPFQVVSSRDGCWVFASISGSTSGVAVLRRNSGSLQLTRTARVDPAPLGMALTHDGKLLIAANGVGVVFLDVDRLTSGKGDAVSGSVPIGTETGTICVNVTLDDRFLFVSDERHASITVVDLTLARSKGGAAKSIVGEIPVGNLPVALTFSPDGRWLYTTSESAASDWDWPEVCDPEGPAAAAPNTPKHPLGAIVVVDVAKAETDPAHAVASRVPAGCSPVRLAISPQGDRAYVTARKTDAVLVFDAGKLVADAEHAELTRVPVGSAPVPVVVVDGGRKVIAGNSNRFAAVHESSTLTVVDAARAATGAGAVIGTISAGVFPRDLALSRDGRTLFVANWGSDSLQMMDVANLPVDPVH